jgi:hypothetical protein
VWDQIYDSKKQHLLFCSPTINVDLATLHPSQAHILKLWQLYLENVDPLLKVTSPTLQSRIIDAAGNVTNICPELEALMFSVYSIAILSLDREECRNTFGILRDDALRAYQLGAREALLNCDFLKTTDRDCLTALHIYLVGVLYALRVDTDEARLH